MKREIKQIATTFGEVTYITLTNRKGSSVVLSSLGAGVVGINVPDRNGKLADVVIGYPTPESYMADGPCAGKTPGRYANRIAGGSFELDGKVFKLPVNNGPNHLHGGPDGFQNHIWSVDLPADDKVCFTLESKDGDAGYPGNLKASVTYTWDDEDNLLIDYKAESDQKSVVNLTNHSYFNLAGHDGGVVKAMDQYLKLNCSRWLPTDDTLVPTGEMAPVDGTPMDFRELRKVGSLIFRSGVAPSAESLLTDFDAIRFGKGYDNCWVADNQDGTVAEIAVLYDEESGRKLTVSTDQPAAQVYGGNWLTGCPEGKDGAVYTDYCAVAIECQGCPDAPNKPGFPSQEVSPEKPYGRTIRFSFSVD